MSEIWAIKVTRSDGSGFIKGENEAFFRDKTRAQNLLDKESNELKERNKELSLSLIDLNASEPKEPKEPKKPKVPKESIPNEEH